MNCRANGPDVYRDLMRAVSKWPGLWPEERLNTQLLNESASEIFILIGSLADASGCDLPGKTTLAPILEITR
ncbi:hypothetical protein Rcae01_01010 [Novipirellula caenicola]|uniref:Uncharacterized protein n=1 Tax=Novipirellula caenicola TaxID=1536901 RepID=A0ABP9VMQ6_9BACT